MTEDRYLNIIWFVLSAEMSHHTIPTSPVDDVERRHSATNSGSEDDDDDSEIGVTYPRMRTALRVLAVCIILVITGVLFILVPYVISPDAMKTMQKYILVGIIFIGVGILIFILDIVWCRYREKKAHRKLDKALSYRNTVYTVSDRQVTTPLAH